MRIQWFATSKVGGTVKGTRNTEMDCEGGSLVRHEVQIGVRRNELEDADGTC